MTDEAVNSGGETDQTDQKEQAQVEAGVADARIKANSIIQVNGLWDAFYIDDLTVSAKQLREAMVIDSIAERLAEDALNRRRLLRRESSMMILESVRSSLAQQNRDRLKNPKDYPNAGNIRFAVQELFKMVFERDGRSIDPQMPIDKKSDPPSKQILPRWRAILS